MFRKFKVLFLNMFVIQIWSPEQPNWWTWRR